MFLNYFARIFELNSHDGQFSHVQGCKKLSASKEAVGGEHKRVAKDGRKLQK
jgi:hypothetical protein